MRRRASIVLLNMLVALAGCAAQPPSGQPPGRPPDHPGTYLAAAPATLYRLLPPPPVAGSPQERSELDELLRLQGIRTPAAARRAADDATVSIFRFADALGDPPAFSRQRLPLTAALFDRIGRDETQFMEPAKEAFARPRPYLTEKRLAPVVTLPPSAAYPSGHSTWAVACAIVLADMLPERRTQIFARAEEYAHNREVAGVHYPSDVAAGHLAGTALAAELFQTPRFLDDEAAATAELRQALGLPQLSRQGSQRH
jgi:acid phosphatase (class A)